MNLISTMSISIIIISAIITIMIIIISSIIIMSIISTIIIMTFITINAGLTRHLTSEILILFWFIMKRDILYVVDDRTLLTHSIYAYLM